MKKSSGEGQREKSFDFFAPVVLRLATRPGWPGPARPPHQCPNRCRRRRVSKAKSKFYIALVPFSLSLFLFS